MRFHAYIKPERKDGRLLFIVTRDGDQVHRDYIDHNSKWERDKLIEGASPTGWSIVKITITTAPSSASTSTITS